MSTTDTCTLNITQLPDAAKEAHVIPGLTHSSLLSIGKFFDAGCIATFDSNKVHITKDATTLLTGARDRRTGLWRLSLSLPPSNKIEHNINNAFQQLQSILTTQCNSAYKTQSMPDLINFLHAAAFSPAVSTWIQAIQRNFFRSWPGLTTAAVRQHLTPSKATTKGHLDQTRKNIRSTKKATSHDVNLDLDAMPIQDTDNKEMSFQFATIVDSGRIYTDQTGCFPVTSSQGNQYILVLYDYDSNAILVEPLKN
jgi:hypothetical protein